MVCYTALASEAGWSLKAGIVKTGSMTGEQKDSAPINFDLRIAVRKKVVNSVNQRAAD